MGTFLNNWDEVGVELGKLGQAKAALKTITGEIDEQIALIKTGKEQELNVIEKEIKQLVLNIVEYAETHIAEIRTEEKKHITFATGVIKTRQETDYKYPGDKILVKKLEQLGFAHLIKSDPKPDKKGIKDEAEDNPDLFKQLGIKVEEYIGIDVEPLF